MISRLEQRLQMVKGRQEKALIPYIMSGDPDLKSTVKLALTLADSGADVIELGIPFSAPVADGPAIQKAATRALSSKTTVACVLKAAADIRKESDIPIVLMTYYNPVLQYGLHEFAESLLTAGIDGMIVPDLPMEESSPLQAILNSRNIALVPLISPTSTEERIQSICSQASGFIYCVSVTGVTGARDIIETDLSKFTSRVKKHTKLPLAVGFGISGPDSAAAVSQYCDAVVVGSSLVNLVEKYGDTQELYKEIGQQVSDIKFAINNTGGGNFAAL
ncbi:MAG: tryptophan synthase subunit alpha [Firmicutes bacterium]|nr:tryptophan synthase subunit alpha [Bacillota bacterium]